MSIPSVGDVLAAFFAGGHQAAEPGVCYDSCVRIEPEPDPDEPVPFTLTDQAEAELEVGQPEPEAEP